LHVSVDFDVTGDEPPQLGETGGVAVLQVVAVQASSCRSAGVLLMPIRMPGRRVSR